MEPARRLELMRQSRGVRFERGKEIFAAGEPPAHVLIIFQGEVRVFGKLPGEAAPVLLEELGPGDCVGWSAALSGVPGVCAVATKEVDGLLVPAPAFLEITRYDCALKEALYSKAWRAEVWRAVLSEMERRSGVMRSARAIVDNLLPQCVARDWPEEEAQILEDGGKYAWVVVGGEGAMHGEAWNGGDGVLWARMIGLPEDKLVAALAPLKVEPRVSSSPSADKTGATSNEKALVVTEKVVSSSEARADAADASRSQSALKGEEVSRSKRVWPKRMFVLMGLFLAAIVTVAWWASEQRIVQKISVPGRLTFAGEVRPLHASVAGTLSELNVRTGQRLETGAVLAVIRPPFDEARLRALDDKLAQARNDTAYCEAFLAGQSVADVGVSPELLVLMREHEVMKSELRVLSAIQNGGKDVAGLTGREQQRVTQHFAGAQSARAEKMDVVARDAATRHEDLREAERELREAQEEVRTHQKSFSGARTEDKKEAAQEMADYQRVLGFLNGQVLRRQEKVNRFKRELQVMKAESEPFVPLVEDQSTKLTHVQGVLARIEGELKTYLTKAKEIAVQAEGELKRVRTEAAPRQIIARAPGLISETSMLALGASVQPDTPIAQLVLREIWQIECAIAPEQMLLLQPGQNIRVAYTDRAGAQTSCVERLVRTRGMRLQVQATRDEWRDGMQVQIETDVVQGSLLDRWLGRI